MAHVSKGVVLKPLSGFFENQERLPIQSCSIKGGAGMFASKIETDVQIIQLHCQPMMVLTQS
jgi:hypothetical protein